jgi:hypothetical protein
MEGVEWGCSRRHGLAWARCLLAVTSVALSGVSREGVEQRRLASAREMERGNWERENGSGNKGTRVGERLKGSTGRRLALLLST